MILVLCANAGVDRTYEVPGFQLGHLHHPRKVRIVAGGKGANVARVLRALKHSVTLAGFAGGKAGTLIAADLRKTKIKPALTQIREESRTTVTIVDANSRQVTRLDEVGPLVSPAEVQELRSRWRELLEQAEMAVIAGNPPRGVPRGFYVRLVKRAQQQAVPVLVDAHEEPLQEAVGAQAQIIKSNLPELNWLAKRQLTVPEGVVEFSRELVEEGVETVLTTLGREGAILVMRGHDPLRIQAPEVKVVSCVGSGDAATAGWVAATCEGREVTERARWAVACGAANCMQLGAGECTRKQVEELVGQTKLTVLA